MRRLATNQYNRKVESDDLAFVVINHRKIIDVETTYMLLKNYCISLIDQATQSINEGGDTPTCHSDECEL